MAQWEIEGHFSQALRRLMESKIAALRGHGIICGFVTRSHHDEAEVKLQLAGASRVVSPYTIGGQRMAAVALERGGVE